MELSVRILSSPEVAAGFALSGIRVDAVEDAAAADALRRLADDPDVGVVLIEERLRKGVPGELQARIDRKGWPIVVAFPSPAWTGPSAAEEYVLELLRQAVGYRVRPR